MFLELFSTGKNLKQKKQQKQQIEDINRTINNPCHPKISITAPIPKPAMELPIYPNKPTSPVTEAEYELGI